MAKKRGRVENLTPGNLGNKGGTGRPPEWFRGACAELASHEEVLKFLGKVVKGEPVEERILPALGGRKGAEEVKVLVTAAIKDRITAWEKLADRGFGKVAQEAIEARFIIELSQRITLTLNRTIPEKCPHCAKPLTLRENIIKTLEDLSKQMDAPAAVARA